MANAPSPNSPTLTSATTHSARYSQPPLGLVKKKPAGPCTVKMAPSRIGTRASPFTEEDDGRISNQVRVKIANRSESDAQYQIAVSGAEEGAVIIPVNPFPVAHGSDATTSIFVLLPRKAFEHGDRMITVTITSDHFSEAYPYRLLGPREGGADDASSRARQDQPGSKQDDSIGTPERTR